MTTMAKRAKLRALRPKDDQIGGPGFVVEHEYGDGALLKIAVNPSRDERGCVLITRMSPLCSRLDGYEYRTEIFPIVAIQLGLSGLWEETEPDHSLVVRTSYGGDE